LSSGEDNSYVPARCERRPGEITSTRLLERLFGDYLDAGNHAGCHAPHLIDRLVQGLGDMETVQDQFGIGAMVFDGSNVCLTHVAASPFYLVSLVITKLLGEE